MNESEKIFVIEENRKNKLKVKGSQFLGFSYKVNSSDEALNKLELLKKELYDASHHCYAYKIKSDGEKYSDDGEPTGTAGIRILNAINHYSVSNILIVVVRYFGGTKLGVGPLGKAYGETATNLLFDSEIIEYIKYEKISISYNYDHVSSVNYLINKYKCKKINNIYISSPSIECYIEPFLMKNISSELTEKTSGNVDFKQLNDQIYLRLK